MNRIIKPALVVMAVFLAPVLALRAETGAAKAGDVDIAGITRKVAPSVVKVMVQNHLRRVATGVVIDREGHVVTTALMSPRDETITITTSSGKTVDAEFLGFDTETQLALLKAKDKGLVAVALGKSEDLAPGSWVCAVGISPEGEAAVTQGIVSSLGEDRLRLNIWVTPGSSGGPVVDDKGQMVGLLRGVYVEDKPVVFQFRDREQTGSGYVISQAEAPSSGMAIAVPIEVVRAVADEIKAKGRVERGWLGLWAGMNQDGRVQIGQVEPDSPAGLAKLREGDIVLALDGTPVASAEMLSNEIRKRKPGQDITLEIERDGKPMEVKVKLGEYTEDEAKREMEQRFPTIFPPLGPEPGTPPPASPRRYLPGRPGQAPSPFGWSFEQRKFIGVYADELTPELARHFGAKEGPALIVSRLTEGGPAEKAGLKVGDVIVRVDGRSVGSRDDLIDLVQSKKPGDKVKLEVLRDKKPMTFEVPVEEDEKGGELLGSTDLDSFLRSWQGYTDAFQQEILKWQNQYSPELRARLDKLREEMTRDGKSALKDLKLTFKSALKKI